MFDGLMKSKFYTKCKSLTRMAKTRLEALKKRKNVVAKYLKNDMAYLMRSDLDDNAYCRVEGLLVEQNMIACYNLLEQFCGCISSNISLMSKQKECPEECKEAVQSLIYAAARFSKFPELRDLRALFTERYGTSLEPFTNNEFVERLRQKAATQEMKLQLMQDVAQEFSIDWNGKSLEQKLFQPPSSQQDQQRHESVDNTNDNAYKWEESKEDYTVPKIGIKEDNADDRSTWKKNEDDAFTERDEVPGEKNFVKRDAWEFPSHGRKNSSVGRYKGKSSSEDEVFTSSGGGSTDLDSLQASSSSVGSVSEGEVDSKKPFYYRFIPPPYLKPKVEKKESKTEESPKSNGNIAAEETAKQDNVGDKAKPKPRSVRRRPLQPPPGHENAGNTERPLKLPPGHEKVGSVENDGSARTMCSAVKQEEPRWGSRISQTDDGDDEEEKLIDGLLMHYSKKNSPYEPREVNSSLKPPPSWQNNDDIGDATRLRNAISELPIRPARKLSEPITPTEAVKRQTRAISMQPEMLSRHVHPNLPDCDELAARIAVLKGR